MLKKNIAGLLLILTLGIASALAQNYSDLENDPAERAAILAALSAPVSKELKQKITFSEPVFRVKNNWAFVNATAQNAKGGDVNWKITAYRAMVENGDFEQGIPALLKKTGGKWRVVKYLMNCHDVCYLDWSRKYKAPKEIIE